MDNRVDNMNRKKKIIVIAVILVMVILIIPSATSFFLYQSVFGVRYDYTPQNTQHIEDYPGLQRERYEIISDDGQKVIGYNYHNDNDDVKGIILFAHGLGGGHQSYMDTIDYIVDHGYYVFGYDVTGNGESEGNSIKGLPQGVIDLDNVISFIEKRDEFDGLPIGLIGHSWGGYSVVNSLNQHPEVDCVVSVAGFSKSSDLLKAQGKQMVGPIINILIPYINAIESVKFGEYSSQTGLEALSKTDASVMIIHGGKDTTVPQDYGYDLYYEKYADDPDFEFVYLPDAGHNGILGENIDNVLEKIMDFYDKNMTK